MAKEGEQDTKRKCCIFNQQHFTQLTPVSQMEVGCSRIWELKPTTQTQVGGTPHKPAQPATQPRVLPISSDPKSSTRHTEQWVKWKKTIEERPLLPWKGGGEREILESLRAPTHGMPSQAKSQGHVQAPLTNRTARRRHGKAPHKNNTHTQTLQAPPKILINPNTNTMQCNATPHHARQTVQLALRR